MESRIVDQEIRLIRYYPNYKTALSWYQDPELCRQVDNRDTVYDLALLKAMYQYLNRKGTLFYIKYKNRRTGCAAMSASSRTARSASWWLSRFKTGTSAEE